MNLGFVKWPAGLPAFYKNLDKIIGKIIGGLVLVVDPSSGSRDSMPGYAWFDGGKLISSGVIKIPLTLTIEGRLRFLHDRLYSMCQATPPTVLVVEEVHKAMAHVYLLWAVGVTMAAARSTETLQLPIPVWKAAAKVAANYVKGDEADAIIMGQALVKLARERAGQ